MSRVCITTLIAGFLYFATEALYLDSSDPWKPGPLEIETFIIFQNDTDIPMTTKMYYPRDLDEYAVFYYVGGVDGAFPPEIYGGMLRSIASHGYVVAGTWPLRGQDGFNHSHHAHLQNIEWLSENLEDEIGMSGSWEHLGYGCHSAGCGTTYEMTRAYPDQVMTNLFLEPVSPAIHAGENCVNPALMLGAKLAVGGGCHMAAFDYVVYYNYWECPRILMEAEEYGHCDILDYPAWLACNATGFCGDKAPEEMLPAYHDFVQGISSAMMNTYVQGQPHYLDYLLTEEDIPLKLSMYETDVEC